jgi:hypothetical protein
MYGAFLVPEITIEANGESEPAPVAAAAGKPVLLALAITRIVEQESLDVSIWGSADGKEWGAKPLAVFPQKFYQGVYEIFLDLGKNPEVQYLRAKWAVHRWGVGSPKPHFSFLIQIQEQSAAAAKV